MMRAPLRLAAPLLGAVLAGCSSTYEPPMPLPFSEACWPDVPETVVEENAAGHTEYRVCRNARTKNGTEEELRGRLMRVGGEYCRTNSTGVFRLLRVRSAPADDAHTARVELIFACVGENGERLRSVYELVSELDEKRRSGLLTEEAYRREKKALLRSVRR